MIQLRTNAGPPQAGIFVYDFEPPLFGSLRRLGVHARKQLVRRNAITAQAVRLLSDIVCPQLLFVEFVSLLLVTPSSSCSLLHRCRLIDELRATVGNKANRPYADIGPNSCGAGICINSGPLEMQW